MNTTRRLLAADAVEYRAVRLLGLHDHPEAFGTAWEEEADRPLAWFEDRLDRHAVFGGLAPGGRLLGVAGLIVDGGMKSSHRGLLWGMFVRPEARRTGLSAALVARVIDHATGRVEALRLAVSASNTAAIRLYAKAGFCEYGLDRRALKVGGRYLDELLMALSLHDPG